MNEERKAVLDKLFLIVDQAMNDIDKGEYDKANTRFPYARLLQECLMGDQSEKGFEKQNTPDDKSVQETKSQEDTVIMANTVSVPVEEPVVKEIAAKETEVKTDPKKNDVPDPDPTDNMSQDEPTPVKEKDKKKPEGKYSAAINEAIADGIEYPVTGWPHENMTDEEKVTYYNSLYKAGKYDLRNDLMEHLTQEEIQHIFRVPVETLTTGYFGISNGFEQDNGTQIENNGTGGGELIKQDDELPQQPEKPIIEEPVIEETPDEIEFDSESDEKHTDSETNQGDQEKSEEKGEGDKTDTETTNERVSANDEVEQKKEEKQDDVRDMIEQMVNEEFGNPTVEQVCYAMNNPQTEIFMKYYAVISLILSEIIKKQKKFLGVSNFDPLVRKLIEYVSQVYAVHAGVKGYTQELIDERVSQDYYGLRQLYDIDIYSEFSKQLGEGDMKELLEKRIKSMGDKYRETAEDIVSVYGTLYESTKLFDAKKADKASIHIVKKHRNQVYQVAGWEATAKELKYGEMPFKLKDPKAPKTTKWTPELKEQMAEQRNIQYAAKELMKSYCTAEESKSICRVITGGVYSNLSDTIVNPSTITYVNRVLNELLKNIYQYYGFESLEDVVKTLGIVEKEE